MSDAVNIKDEAKDRNMANEITWRIIGDTSCSAAISSVWFSFPGFLLYEDTEL